VSQKLANKPVAAGADRCSIEAVVSVVVRPGVVTPGLESQARESSEIENSSMALVMSRVGNGGPKSTYTLLQVRVSHPPSPTPLGSSDGGKFLGAGWCVTMGAHLRRCGRAQTPPFASA
jgi:hypothetical protein